MKKILLVEDDKEIINILLYILEKEYIVNVATSKKEAVELINKGEDLAILDICLPDGNSFEFSENLICPIIYLTAKDDEESIVKCLTTGEEYVPKPFKTKELLIRIDKILKRIVTINIHYKDIIIDTHSHKVYIDKEEVNLTLLDYKIVEYLFSNIGTIISRDKMADLIYDNTSKYVEDNSISVYIKRVRDKLDRDYIRTIKGLGYTIEKN